MEESKRKSKVINFTHFSSSREVSFYSKLLEIEFVKFSKQRPNIGKFDLSNFILLEELTVWLSDTVCLLFKPGFVWNGITDFPDKDMNTLLPSILHDGLTYLLDPDGWEAGIYAFRSALDQFGNKKLFSDVLCTVLYKVKDGCFNNLNNIKELEVSSYISSNCVQLLEYDGNTFSWFGGSNA